VIPLYGFLRGDTIGLLILARPDDTVAVLAERLQDSAALRVPKRQGMVVVFKDRILDARITVARAGLTALDKFEVIPVEPA
jgi:hypothetical protein